MNDILFLDEYPITLKGTSEGNHAPIPAFPLVITHTKIKKLEPKHIKRAHDWAFDTCFSGQIVTSRKFLEDQYKLVAAPANERKISSNEMTYLDPNGHCSLDSNSIGKVDNIPVFRASLWIVSNIPHFRDSPLKLSLPRGVATQPGRTKNLLGRHVFFGTGIRVQLNFDNDTPKLSLWAPPSMFLP